MHQEDVLRSGLVWVEIGGMRFFKFLKRGGGWLLRLTSVGGKAGGEPEHAASETALQLVYAMSD